MSDKIYHWTELNGNTHVKLYPDMLEPKGFVMHAKCRLKGQGNRGVKAVEPEVRAVKFDTAYCIHKLGGLLKHLSHPDQERLLKVYLKSNNPTAELVHQENDKEDVNNAEDVRNQGDV